MTNLVRGINSYTASVGDVLRKNVTYIVPEYQRDYSWTSDEVDTLWQDIINASTRSNDDYFMGAIVVSHSNKRDSWDIVDGQQRIATLSILLSVIQKKWKVLEDERHLDIRRDYLGDRDRETREFSPKIRLNANNDETYYAVTIEHKISKGQQLKLLSKSNRLINNAFTGLEDKLDEWLTTRKTNDTALIEIERFISNRLKLIVIEAVSDYDAYLIFETLNDRGLDLAVSDLVKNHLFRLGGSHLDDFKRKWLEISTLVGEDLKVFLRHFWISENQLINEKDLYKAIREKIASNTTARNFIEKMRKSARYYVALSTPESEFWNDFPDDVRSDLTALGVFKVSQYKPIVLAIIDKFTPDEVARCIKILTVISFRYTIVSGLGTGSLEKIYGSVIQAINKGTVKSPKALFDHIKSAYVDDVKFKHDFSTKEFDKAPIARYVLAKVCESISKDDEREVLHNGKATLEHIMPRQYISNWSNDSDNIEEYINRIGNLTLLERKKNQKISNKSFEDKLPILLESNLEINSMLRNFNSWEIDSINSRSNILANEAIKVWGIVY